MTTSRRPALAALGWDEAYESAYAPWIDRPGRQPGRVALAFNQNFRVVTDDGEVEEIGRAHV